MKRSVKQIISIIPTILLAGAGYFFTKNFDLSINLGVLLVIVIGVTWVISLIFDIQNQKYKELEKSNVLKQNEISDLNNEINSLKKEMDKIRSSLTVSLGEDKKGNDLLFMALTQHPAEPLKITMLEKATNEHNNIIAALILGNIYEYGVKSNGKVLLKENAEEAFKIYEKICENDNYGVSDWLMGWFYQNKYIENAKGLSDDERYEKARKFYETSKNKGFPKAKNSLGNFIINNRAGFDSKKNIGAMIRYYSEADEQGDNYATLNYGHYYLKQFRASKDISFLEEAKSLYEKAAKMKSPEGYLKLAITNVEFYMRKKDIQYLEDAKESLINAVFYSSGQFAAAGYCILGTLTKQYPDIFKRDVTKKLPSNRFNNPIIECYVISYEIFLGLIASKKNISEENKRYFEALSSAFQNANIEFLKFPIGY